MRRRFAQKGKKFIVPNLCLLSHWTASFGLEGDLSVQTGVADASAK